MKGITLRRTKNSKVAGRALVQLPERRVFVQHVTLSEEEREEYEQVKREGRNIVGRWAHFCYRFKEHQYYIGLNSDNRNHLSLQVFPRRNGHDELCRRAGHPGPSEAVLLSPQSCGQIHSGRYKLEFRQSLITFN